MRVHTPDWLARLCARKTWRELDHLSKVTGVARRTRSITLFGRWRFEWGREVTAVKKPRP